MTPRPRAARPPGPRWGPLVAAILAAALALVLVTSWLGPSEVSDAETLAGYGFDDISGVEVVSVEEFSGLDTSIEFTLRGTADAIDRVLAQAEFVEPPQRGVEAVRISLLPEADLTGLGNLRNSQDRRVKPSGDVFSRAYIRGTTADGTDVLHGYSST